MKIKNILFCLMFGTVFSILFLLNYQNVFGLQITKVVYDPENDDTGKEWFEVCNDKEDIGNFADIYKSITPPLKDSSKTYSEHTLNPEATTNQVNFPTGSCAAIVQDVTLFKKYNPTYTNLIFDSSWTNLNNSDGFVGILKDKNILVCQKYGNAICPESGSVSNDSNSTSSSSSTNSINTNTNEKIVYVYVPQNNQQKYGDIQVLLPEEKLVTALAETEYTVKVTDSKKQTIKDLTFHWSFGDGGEKEGRDAAYSYMYPGEYLLIATADGFTSGAQARMNVKVVEPDIEILKVGEGEKENFISLKNNTEYDLSLSNFLLNIDNNFYKLPKNLFLAKKKITNISGEAVGFKLPAKTVELLYPNKRVLISYVKNESLEKEIAKNIVEPELSLNLEISLVNNFNAENKEIKAVNINKNIIKSDTLKVEQLAESVEKSPIILKKLVLDDNKGVNNLEKSKNLEKNLGKNKEVENNNKSVDINLVKWFKNLLY